MLFAPASACLWSDGCVWNLQPSVIDPEYRETILAMGSTSLPHYSGSIHPGAHGALYCYAMIPTRLVASRRRFGLLALSAAELDVEHGCSCAEIEREAMKTYIEEAVLVGVNGR